MALGPGQWSHQVVVGSAAGEVLFLDFRQPDAAAASAASDSASDASDALRRVGSGTHPHAECRRWTRRGACRVGSGSLPTLCNSQAQFRVCACLRVCHLVCQLGSFHSVWQLSSLRTPCDDSM